MPKIRQYTAQEEVHASDAAASATASAGTAIREGFNSVASSVGGAIKGFGQQIDQADEMADEQRRTALFELDARHSAEWQERIRTADPAQVPELAEAARQDLAEKASEIVSTMETQRGRAAAQRQSAIMEGEFLKRSMGDTGSAAGIGAVDAHRTALEQGRTASRNDPAAWRSRLAAYDAFLEDGSVPTEQRLTLHRAAAQGFSLSAAEGFVGTAIANPETTPAQFDQLRALITDPKNGFTENMDADQYNSVLSQLDNARQTRAHARTSELEAAFPNIIQRVGTADGKDIDGAGAAAIAEVRAGGTVEDQNKADRMQRDLNEAKATGEMAAGTLTMPVPEIDAKIEALRQQELTAPPEQLRDIQAREKAIVAVATARDKAFYQDQAAYVTQNSPSVAAAAQAFSQQPTPQNFSAYARMSMAEQTRLYPGVVPKLVTPQLSQQIGTAIANVPEGRNGAVAAGRILSQWSQVAGPAWPQMAHELMDAKVINSDQYVAAVLYAKPQAQAIAEQILIASSMKPEELAQVRGIKVSEAQEAARDALSDLSATLGNAPNGVQLIKSYQDALAKVLMYRGNLADAEAVAGKMINDEFTFRGTLRIPNTPGNDSGMIERGTEAIQSGLDRRQIVIPASNSGLGPDDQKQNYLRQLQMTGQWYANEDGSGAILYDEDHHVVKEQVPVGVPAFDTRHAPGMRAAGNAEPWNRPVLQNPDGSYSTTSSMSIGTDKGEVLIPTVVNGKRLSNAEAIAHYRKTGENFGTFDTPAHADAYATALHNAQASMRDEHGRIKTRAVDVEFRWKTLQDFGLRNQTILDRTGRFVTGGEQGPIDLDVSEPAVPGSARGGRR